MSVASCAQSGVKNHFDELFVDGVLVRTLLIRVTLYPRTPSYINCFDRKNASISFLTLGRLFWSSNRCNARHRNPQLPSSSTLMSCSRKTSFGIPLVIRFSTTTPSKMSFFPLLSDDCALAGFLAGSVVVGFVRRHFRKEDCLYVTRGFFTICTFKYIYFSILSLMTPR